MASETAAVAAQVQQLRSRRHISRQQDGYIWLERHKETGKPLAWYGRWRENVLRKDGTIKRVQRSQKLADYGDRYRSEKDVRPMLDAILSPLNSGRADARSTMPIAQFVDSHYMPFVGENCKPSTEDCYKKLWRQIKPHLAGVELRDFRTVDAANLLNGLAKRGLGRRSLQHTKSLLSGIFTYAKNLGVLDGINPVRDALIPKKAKPPQETHAANRGEVLAMLDALGSNLKAQAAVGLTFFAGLRPGEARGARWEDYDAHYNEASKQFEWRLTVRQSVWRTHTTAPKTESSIKPVPIIEPLRSILAELRAADGNPTSGPILRGPSGKPLNLANLARREIIPALQQCGLCHKPKHEHEDNDHTFELDKSVPQWRGWYSFRRGIATELVAVTRDPMAAKGLLRHSSVVTTAAHYIKDVPEVTERGLQEIEQLCSNCAVVEAVKTELN